MMSKLKKKAVKAAKMHWFAHHKPLVIVSCFILVALITAIFIMGDKNNNQYLYGNVMNVGGSSTTKQVNPNVPLDKRRSDLKVSNLSVDRGNCQNGRRQVMFNFVESNLSLFTSSEFYTVVYQNGNMFGAGYGSYSTIPGGTHYDAGFGGLLLASGTGGTGGQWVKVQVSIIPVNHIPDGLNRQDALNTYTNRALDANPANNTLTQMVYVNPCP